MTGHVSRRRGARLTSVWAVAACVLLVATACAERAGDATGSPSGEPSAAPPTRPDQLVLRIERVGGFLPVGVAEASVPVLSIYGDGRVIVEGPVPAIYPGPALPNLQVQRIGADDVSVLVGMALAAGVRDTGDLGRPAVADAATTRFTVVTAGGTYVREAYALLESTGHPRIGTPIGVDSPGPDQLAARRRLTDLYRSLTDLDTTLGSGAVGRSTPYAADAVAAVVTPYEQPTDGPAQSPRPWPGPELPGDPLGGQGGLSCVSATGSAATALLDAARQANALTPWISADGRAWSVRFRPLLPDESGCADLAG